MGASAPDRSDPLLFPRLSAAQLGSLRRYGEIRATSEGQLLFREGNAPVGLIAVLAGRVAVVDRPHGTEREISVHDPGGFVGELALMTGQ